MNKEQNEGFKKDFTINDFIEKNYKLLSVLAIFATLIGFSSILPKLFAYSLVLLFFTAMGLVLIEIFTACFKMGPSTFSLFVFKWVLSAIIIIIIIYLLSIFRVIDSRLISCIIFIIFFEIFGLIIFRIRLLNAFFAKKSRKIVIVLKILILIVILILSFSLSKLLTPLINSFLNGITKIQLQLEK